MHEFTPSATEARQRAIRVLRRMYPMRLLGVSLLALPFGSAVLELGLPASYWIAFALNGLVWPHLAFWISSRAKNPRRTEYRNLVMDTALGGFWIATVHLNMMPVAAMVSIFIADRVIAGGWRLLWHASLALLLVFALTWSMLGLPFQPHSSMRTTLLSLLTIFIYMLALGHVSRKMARRIAGQNQALQHLSRFDPALDLPNRRFFNQRADELLQHARQYSHPVSLMFLDVDLFKQVNDRFGHAAGDAVLQRIAKLLIEYAGHEGFAARVGGDEFVLLLSMSEAAAMRVADNLQQAVAQMDLAECVGWRISISVGIAGLQPEHANLDAWLMAADDALYKAKALNGHRRISDSHD